MLYNKQIKKKTKLDFLSDIILLQIIILLD